MKLKEEIFKNQKFVVLFAVITTLLWGSAFPCIKIGYALFQIEGDSFSQILFAGLRFALAGILVIIFTRFYQKKWILPDKSSLKGIVLIGLVQTTLEYVFLYIGIAYTTGIKSSILYSANTFIAVILAHFLCHNEKLNIRKSLGCFSGFIGVIIINLNGSGIDGGFSFIGEGMVLLAAAAFGVGALLSKKTAQKGDSMIITGYQLLLGGLVLILLGIGGKGHLSDFNFAGGMILLYLALLSAVAFTLWTILLKYNEVAKITVYNFLIPIFGVILSAVFLGEPIFELRKEIALLFVCLGIYIINKPKLK